MISSFHRSILIRELLKKIETWKLPETKERFYKGFSTNPMIPSFGIDRDDDGYFYSSDNLVAYCNLRTGYVFRIRKEWGEQDWNCYNELYQLGLSNGKFRIDVPLYRQDVAVDGSTWEYAELQSPNKEYGVNFNDDVFEWPELIDGYIPNPEITDSFREQIVTYYKEFIDQSFEIMSAAVSIAEKNNVGLPNNLVYPSTRFKDSVGYFWSDFDQSQWTHSKSLFLQHSIAMLDGSLNWAQMCGCLNVSDLNVCSTYARTKWLAI
jgi:hypothetical protein